MSINETVMEMHFHRPLLDLFRETLGLGKGSFNFYKYSTQKECFLGFDQAFVQTELSEDQLFQKLKTSAMNDGYNLENFFLAYFLQFKVVKMMQRRARHTPSMIRSRPHYRISIDSQKNINTGLSQHELLYNLNQNIGAMVYYACPMLFDRAELYKESPNLDLLRLADLQDCPSIYSDNESHFVYFDDVDSEPIWCSEPVEGKAITPEQLVKKILLQIESGDVYQSQLKLLEHLGQTNELSADLESKKLLDLVEDSLMIVHWTQAEAMTE
jgi:hypothetical protein